MLYPTVVHHLVQSIISALDQLHEIKANFFPALHCMAYSSKDGMRFLLDEQQHCMAQSMDAPKKCFMSK